ncbi:MAG: hypothetical protein M0Z60_11610 [Nitrospiraceae bacterium]|nr:hypothetical protein [Nitrospiraceae bacterium]
MRAFRHLPVERYLTAGFIIGPGGRIESAVYSSRPIGRLVEKDWP